MELKKYKKVKLKRLANKIKDENISMCQQKLS